MVVDAYHFCVILVDDEEVGNVTNPCEEQRGEGTHKKENENKHRIAIVLLEPCKNSFSS